MIRKLLPFMAFGIISAYELTARAQNTSKVVQQDSLYVHKSQADSLKKKNPEILELSISEVSFGKKTRIQAFYSNPNSNSIRGVSFVDKKKDICKKLKEELLKTKESLKMVYSMKEENPVLNNNEVYELMKCLNAERYWIYQGDYFF